MNRFNLVIIGVFFGLLAFSVQATEGENKQNLIAISLIMDADQPAAGSSHELAIIMKPTSGWHGYWLNPGDAGFPTNFTWQLPESVRVGEVQYPAPSRLIASDMMNYIYHGEYALLVPITLDNNIPNNTQITIALAISYLVCNPEACLPEQQAVETTFNIGAGDISKDTQSKFSQWFRQLPKPLSTEGSFSQHEGLFTLSLPLPSTVKSNDAHVYPITNNLFSNSTKQEFTHVGDTIYMQTALGEEEASTFQGVITFKNGLALSFDAKKMAQVSFGGKAVEHSENNNIWLLSITALLGAILGGVLLNIMPCVFPILSLKVLSLSTLGTEKDAKKGAIAYTLGAVFVCILLGGLIIALRALGHQIGWAFQLQNPAVIAVLILLMSAIGFNLAGLFELGTLTSGSTLQESSGPMGDFWTGVLAAFIATPCTGPFMATALGAALVLPTSMAFLIFAGLGVGMALPFLLVGFMPSLRTRLPKPGAWMITARRILSVPMFITTLGLVWILMRQSNDNFVLSVLAVLMLSTFGLWITGLRQQSQRKAQWWPAIILTVIPLLAVINVVSHAQSQLTNERTYDETYTFNEQQLNTLRSKQDVFLYFTADWCITCKVNEKTSIGREEVQAAFKQQNVAVMKGDWTNGDSQITEFLSRHNRSGVPLYLWYKKGGNSPTALPQILTPSILINNKNNADVR